MSYDSISIPVIKDRLRNVRTACALVVLAVRDFPGEVWDKHGRMQHPARGIVQRFGI